MLKGKGKWGLALFGAAALSIGGTAWLKPGPDRVTISIVGDIMLSRGVERQLEEHGYDYPYGDVKKIFLQDDFTIGNLECPITGRANPADKPKRFLFKADVENAAALKKAGFDCLNLANNHSMDYLSDGLLDTMMNLEENGLSFVGAWKHPPSSGAWVFEKNGVKVGILAYSAFPPEGYFFDKEKPSIRYASTMDLPALEKDISSLDCDFTIAYFHWGMEYQPYKSQMQDLMGKTAIDAGADLVVGSHPHVLQKSEVYKGKHIYYSLGNFVFDRQIPPGTDESMILQLTIGKHGLLGVKEIPLVIKKAKPSWPGGGKTR